MAGKSTHMRQTALIVLDGPRLKLCTAQEANIGICDHLPGEALLMTLQAARVPYVVEMTEVANIPVKCHQKQPGS